MNIHDILNPDAIKVPLESMDKKGAIDELCDLLCVTGRMAPEDAETLKNAVWQREQQRSTGIGEGLAIPHGKCACAHELLMAIGLPSEPIEFDAIDRQPVRMIVLLASPPDRTSDHIQALGKISRLMSRVDFREAAYDADSAENLYKLFEQAEKTEPVKN